jgi:hypothetical protein
MNRKEHLDWCKERALKYVDDNDLINAFASMTSDLGKHPDTENHVGIEMGMMLVVSGQLDTQDKMRNYIEGFN